MAERHELASELDEAIKTLADKAGSAGHHTIAVTYASAARQLAEARAWIIAPAYPHGGNSDANA